MSYIKRILVIACFVGLSISAYAAVTPLNKSEYGVLMGVAPLAATGETGDCSYSACPTYYTGTQSGCSLKNPSGGRQCKTINCCLSNAEKTISECPAEYQYSVSDSEMSSIAGLGSREYCIGYKNGVKSNWFYENPQLCSMLGITDASYIATLSDTSSCGSYKNMTEKSCNQSNDTDSVNACVLSSTVGYPKCKSGDSSLSSYPFSSCGTGGNEAAIPCYTECGNSKYCLRFTCAKDILEDCTTLENAKKAEGWFSSGISPIKTDDIYQQCLDSGTVKYLGFFCQNYFEKNDCEGDGGTIGEVCQVKQAGSSPVKNVYKCSCGTYQTLAEFCAANHPSDPNCQREYYGAGKKCTLDKDASGNALVKYERYENSLKLCSDIKDFKWVKKTGDSCPSWEGESAPVEDECRLNADGTATTQTICKYCPNYIADNESAAKALCGKGTPVGCHYEGTSLVYMSCTCDENTYKSKEDWCKVEPYNKEPDCLYSMVGSGDECHTKPKTSGGSVAEDIVTYSKLSCSSEFKTKQEWCNANASSIVSGYDCMKDYVGQGVLCKDGSDNSSDWKYTNYALGCPEGANSNIQRNAEDCSVDKEGGATPYYDRCLATDSDGKQIFKYICKCPPGYGTDCAKAYEVRGGRACTFDYTSTGLLITKYERCQISCKHAYAGTFASEIYSCPDIDSYVSSVRGGVEDPQQCILKSDNNSLQYICACPSNFKTIEEWCEENYVSEGLDNANVCIRTYSGRGQECRRDIEVDTAGNPVKVLSKYAYYIRNCPTDRPLYYSSEDCHFINGEYEYSCRDTSLNERVVCQCPTKWYSEAGLNQDGDTCQYAGFNNSLGDNVDKDDDDGNGVQSSYPAEAAGETCDFDGSGELKYEQCVVKCNDVLKDSNVAIPNAYTYLSSDKGTPTNILCATQMGNGAVFGFTSIGADKSYCSLNHTIMYPCYCPASFKECSASENLIAADGAQICSINGKTYYSQCQHLACPTESSTLAVVDAGTDITKEFGEGAVSTPCSVKDSAGNIVDKMQVTCNASEFSDPCDYPYEAPKNGTWCKYGDGTTLMKDGRAHYKAGACRIKKTLGECGKEIAGASEGKSYQIFVASTESECKNIYGPGISTQLCEYGAEQGYKRAYNCYYDPTDFKYTTANCGVRHDLTGNYIIINGKKTWNQCNCASAYKHHKFNCGGMLSGNPCQQELNQTLINGDSSLKEAVEDGFISANVTLPFYPYCQCSADYKEICDEDGSGRYKGVGSACNGKYVSCECVPDKLPDNWTDNYYGCPGGKKPTGVWKDNGCGKKYYQCSVVECTWEYTEMCGAPLIPVGPSCQDNEGNIGGYKACACPEGYKVCPAGQVGEGEPCNLKGVAHYKSCKSQEACTSLATETCTGPLQLGVNPCTRDGITYYERCVCANGYTEVCGEEEVGVGNYCELDGKKYYKECKKPEKGQCLETDGYRTACDTNQESYSPCVSVGEYGKQVVKYLCRCPSNWYTKCEDGLFGGEKCIQNGAEYYSECNKPSENTCSDYQLLTYSVCSSAQTGDGGSCYVGDESNPDFGKTKYAVCKDSNNCYETGFKYSCSGYDQSALGEACIDANGNKLYKSCPCPSSYVACSNGNASKGTKCVPLEASGDFGTPRYSSCSCDRSKYKYTCQSEDSGNVGITPPQGNNYCEVEGEPTVETTTDENGITTTISKPNIIRYYASCDCKAGYQYTCSDGEHGEKIPVAYRNNYCQINSTKFYQGCDCSDEYIKTANDCTKDAGRTPDISSGSCTIKGYVPDSISYGDVFIDDDNPSGGISSSGKANVTLYKGCVCKPNYTLTCDSSVHDLDSIQGCDINGDGVNIKYPKCICKSKNSKTCKTAGKNTGVIPDETSICSERIADANGKIAKTDKYTKCSCKDGFSVLESECMFPEYDQSTEEFCDLSVNASDTDGSEIVDTGKYYKRCLCDPKIYDNSKVMTNDQTVEDYCGDMSIFIEDETQFCTEIAFDKDAEHNRKYIKHPNKNLCCKNGTDLTGYTQLSYEKYNNLADFFEYNDEDTLSERFRVACGHAYNALVTLDCSGRPFFKCSNANVANAAQKVTWYTKDECAGLNKGREVKDSYNGVSKEIINESWKEKTTVYPDCDCNNKYKYSTDDDCVTYYNGLGVSNTKLFCTDSPSSRTPSSSKNRCPSAIFKLYPGDFCIDKNEVKKHERCVCKQGGDQTGNDACISDYCGEPSKGKDDEACWIGGIPEIYNGGIIRVSVYNGGGASGDQTCKCPTARDAASLNGCSGGGVAENVSSCKYPKVTYPQAPYS